MRTYFLAGRMFSGLDLGVVENQTIVVDDGRITYLGSAEEGPRPRRRDKVVDHSNFFVMPGMIDLHVHLAYGNAKSAEDIDLYASVEFRALRGLFLAQNVLASGFTSILDPGTSGRVSLAIRDAINANLFPGPRITACGPYITSRQGVTDIYPTWIGVPETSIGRLARNKAEGIEEIRLQTKDGVDCIKLALDGFITNEAGEPIAAYNEEETLAMVTEAHRLGRRVVAHARGSEAVRYAARAGVELICHASWIDDEGIELALANGCALCPTLTYPYNIAEFTQPSEPAARRRRPEQSRQELEIAYANLERAFRAGVPLTIGTDTGFATTPCGEWHARELALLVEHVGLSPAEALRCATSVSAGLLRDGDMVGAIEAGRHADFVVIDGDPLTDITVLLDPDRLHAVYLGGELASMERRGYDPRQVSEFSFGNWNEVYTRDRVAEITSTQGPAKRALRAV
jgi:imidazolonepropionase-like amidohydrolase